MLVGDCMRVRVGVRLMNQLLELKHVKYHARRITYVSRFHRSKIYEVGMSLKALPECIQIPLCYIYRRQF